MVRNMCLIPPSHGLWGMFNTRAMGLYLDGLHTLPVQTSGTQATAPFRINFATRLSLNTAE